MFTGEGEESEKVVLQQTPMSVSCSQRKWDLTLRGFGATAKLKVTSSPGQDGGDVDVSSWLDGSCGALGTACLQEGGKAAPSTTGTFQEKAHISPCSVWVPKAGPGHITFGVTFGKSQASPTGSPLLALAFLKVQRE